MAANADRVTLTLGEWTVTFRARTAALEGRHRPSGARLSGRLSFCNSRQGEMAIGLGAGLGPGQLALRDARGEAQSYLQLTSAGRDLTLTLVPRGRSRCHGTLTLRGTARLGSETFACRTFAPPGQTVVQMASGPADSALNDSLFDVAKDTALRFQAERVAIATAEAGFDVTLTGRIEDAAASQFTITAEQDYYRSRYVPSYRPLDRKRLPAAPTGWMSWNTYFDKAGEAENLAEARLGAKHLKPYGLEIWSIESWQDNSPSQPVSQFHHLTRRPYAAQFPHGMEWLAQQIRKLGFVPGIWTVPFGTGDAAFYRRRRAWFLHDGEGQPMRNWCGEYVLDPSQPAVRRHMAQTHRAMAEWGYDFFKIDGVFGGSDHYSAQFYERPDVRAAFREPCENPLELCMQALRRGIGPTRTLLACAGHYTGPEVAVSDAARIGGDVVSPDRDPTWRSYLEQSSMILACLFVHGIVWYCDPDTVLVGSYLPREQARVAATAIALAGQVTFAGDKLGGLAEDRIHLLQRCLPACPVRPLDLYPINRLVPIWDLKVSRPFAQWDVVSAFNFGETRGSLPVAMASLGLSPEKPYLVYDFWEERLLGRFTGSVPLEVEAQSNRLLAIHEDLGRPQFLSTDRHLTQGATSLRALAWDEVENALSGEVELVAGETTRLTIAVPAGFRLERAVATGAVLAEPRVNREGTLTVRLHSPRATVTAWQLRFTRRKARQSAWA